MQTLTQNQMINSSCLFDEELNTFSIECLNELRGWIIRHKEKVSEKRFNISLIIIDGQVRDPGKTVFDPGFCYDKKWFTEKLRFAAIDELDVVEYHD